MRIFLLFPFIAMNLTSCALMKELELRRSGEWDRMIQQEKRDRAEAKAREKHESYLAEYKTTDGQLLLLKTRFGRLNIFPSLELGYIQVMINNESGFPVKMIWGDSSFSHDGISSPVVTGETRFIHSDQPMVPVVLPPKSTHFEKLIPRQRVSGSDIIPICGRPQAITKIDGDYHRKFPDDESCQKSEFRLFLTYELKGKRDHIDVTFKHAGYSILSGKNE